MVQPIESVVIELSADEAIGLRDLLYGGVSGDALHVLGLSKLHADLIRGIVEPGRFTSFHEIAKIRR